MTKYIDLIEPVRRIMRAHPDYGARRIASALGEERDTIRKAMATLRAGDPYPRERIAFFDIETSNLKADFGIVLSWCIKPDGKPVIKRVISQAELRNGGQDRRLIADFCTTARKFDRLVGYYSSRFDAPFLRTRALLHRLAFPVYNEVLHTDVYYMVRSRMNLHRRRLETACEYLGIPTKGHRLDGNIWLRALTGNSKALAWILKHNEEDVQSLEKLFHRLTPYTASRNRSI